MSTSLAIVTMFAVLLIGAVMTGRLPQAGLWIYGITSAAAFIVYAFDKSAAQANRWRTPERTLHLLALIGGWPGALLAQELLRHKSSKAEFRRVFWVTVVLNCLLLVYLCSQQGTEWLRQFVR